MGPAPRKLDNNLLMPIKVAFGTTNLFKGLGGYGIDGIGSYCQELLHQLINLDGLTMSPFSFGYKSIEQQYQLLPKYSQYFLKSILDISTYRKNSFFNQFDIIHATDQLVPINIDRPLISTVMDVIPLTHPHLTPSIAAPLKAFIWKKLSRSSDHIITASEYSRQEIVSHMDYPIEKISVIPLGVDGRYFETLDTKVLSKISIKFNLPEKFFLHIGTIQPRKNITRLLHSHALLPNDYAKKYPIILAGRYGWGDQSQYKMIQEAIKEKRCIHINYISDIEKRALLQLAIAMTFVSLYEGFGLPIVEAFASRTPVITSCNSSMIEVAGNAALLVDPLSINEIRDSLLSIIQNQESHNLIVDRGLQIAKQYSWKATAKKTLTIYQKLL
jgi:glycosyltransferase involved in cell wall biosynthesis